MRPALVLAHESEARCRARLVASGMPPEPAGEIAFYCAQSTDMAAEFGALEAACADQGLDFEPVEAHDLPALLARGDRRRVVWPLTDGFAFYVGSAIPAVAALAGVPRIGSSADLFHLCQDKFRSGAVLAAFGLPMPPTALARGDRWLVPPAAPSPSGWFVKPNRLGAKLGIWEDSHAPDEAAALALAARIAARYGDDAVAQPFIAGEDVRISFLDVDGRADPGACGIARLGGTGAFQTMARSLTWQGETGAQARAEGAGAPPALADLRRENPALAGRLEAIARRAMTALGLADVWSMDVRLGRDGSAHLLEFEVAPGLPCFDFRAYLAERHGLALPAAMARVAARRLRESGPSA